MEATTMNGRLRVAGHQRRTTVARARNGSRPNDDRALLFVASVRVAKLPQGFERGAQVVILSHKIALDTTFKQREYFARAAGTARFVWNYALCEWNRQYEAGEKPNSNSI